MLFSYLQRTQLLLRDVTAALYNDADLTTYVNLARGQVAGEGECVRNFSTLVISTGIQAYPFSSISGLATGIASVLTVVQASYAVASGYQALHSRAWPWFQTWVLSQPVPTAGPPSVWAQYGQGANGSLYVNLPDTTYTLSLDCVCLPADFTVGLDSETEVIPYPWTEAVPFYAAYYALLSQMQPELAKNMYDLYETYMRRARGNSNPSVLSGNFRQADDPFKASRLGLVQK